MAGMRHVSWPPRPETVLASERIYLRPRAVLGPDDALRDGPVAERYLPLAGGPLVFGAVDLVLRAGAGGAGAVDTASHATVAELRDWLDRVEPALARPVAAGLTRLTAARAPFAGLALDAPIVMGILNVTPDSFSDGGCFSDHRAAIARGLAMAEAGAGIIDVGGESTRPGAVPVSVAEEIERVLPVIEGLKGAGAVLSIDTRHAAVARAALAAGASILNDVTALADPASAEAAAARGAAVVLMHMQGEPRTMQKAPAYAFAPLDVFDELGRRVAAAERAGLAATGIAVDPGIGFGKTVAHNAEIFAWLGLYHGLGRPLVIGASRKSFIAALSRGEPVERRLAGSLAAALAARAEGVQILRVHDVAETVQAVTVWQRIRR